MKTGIEKITDERQRQIEKEGWTPEHDEQHEEGELALVAALYATPIPLLQQITGRYGGPEFADPWPDSWDDEWDKRKKHRKLRRLVIAGALIAAEIDRIQRQPH